MKTNTTNIEKSTNIKNINIIKGICEICNSKKSQFEKLHINNEEKLNTIYYNTKTGYSGINDYITSTHVKYIDSFELS